MTGARGAAALSETGLTWNSGDTEVFDLANTGSGSAELRVNGVPVATTDQVFLQDGNAFGAPATLGTNDAFDLAVETGGVERVRVTESGDVGIGVLSAAAPLHVQREDSTSAGVTEILKLEHATSLSAAAGMGAGIGFALEDAGGTAEEAAKVEALWTDVGTFSNGWTDYDTVNYDAAGYFKDSMGIVHLKGLVKPGTPGAAAFTLPAGYRPTKNTMFPTAHDGTGAGAYVGVSPAGDVIVFNATGATWVTLGGITFRLPWKTGGSLLGCHPGAPGTCAGDQSRMPA